MNTPPSPPRDAAPARPTDEQIRTRVAHLFRDAVREGTVHPLMPLLLRYRLQQALDD